MQTSMCKPIYHKLQAMELNEVAKSRSVWKSKPSQNNHLRFIFIM